MGSIFKRVPVGNWMALSELKDEATKRGRVVVLTGKAPGPPAKLDHPNTLDDALDVMLVVSDPSNHNFSPEIDKGIGPGGGGGRGGVTPLIKTADEPGEANAPTCDVRTMAPNPIGPSMAPAPDVEVFPARPGGTYCADAFTKEVKSELDGRKTGIITLLLR